MRPTLHGTSRWRLQSAHATRALQVGGGGGWCVAVEVERWWGVRGGRALVVLLGACHFGHYAAPVRQASRPAPWRGLQLLCPLFCHLAHGPAITTACPPLSLMPRLPARSRPAPAAQQEAHQADPGAQQAQQAGAHRLAGRHPHLRGVPGGGCSCRGSCCDPLPRGRRAGPAALCGGLRAPRPGPAARSVCGRAALPRAAGRPAGAAQPGRRRGGGGPGRAARWRWRTAARPGGASACGGHAGCGTAAGSRGSGTAGGGCAQGALGRSRSAGRCGTAAAAAAAAGGFRRPAAGAACSCCCSRVRIPPGHAASCRIARQRALGQRPC